MSNIKFTLFGELDLSFPEVRRGSNSYHIIRKQVQRSESLKELSMTMSRIVFLEVHWSLDRQLNRILLLLHRLRTIAKMLILVLSIYIHNLPIRISLILINWATGHIQTYWKTFFTNVKHLFIQKWKETFMCHFFPDWFISFPWKVWWKFLERNKQLPRHWW